MKEKTDSRTKRRTENKHLGFIIGVFAIPFLLLTSSVYAANLTIDINTADFIRTIPETLYGTNMTCWDSTQDGGTSAYNNLIKALGTKYLRWPGGSWGNAYLWSDMEGPNGANSWVVSYSESLYMMGITDTTIQPIVNFPGIWFSEQHTQEEAIAAAAAWVADQKNRTPSAQYWEIGNEIGGPWEAGWFDGISGSYYGDRFAQYYIAMKAENPAIKIGAVAEPCDTLQPWGWYVGKWTRDMLEAADSNYGVRPDFLIVHQYPGLYMDSSYNPTLLADDITRISDFTASLDNIIATSIGPEYVGQIKYWMTEWNAGGRSVSDYPTSYYERWRLFVNAMFQVQYILEMAKHGWQGSNYWVGTYYWGGPYPRWYTYPNFYVHPFLTNKFGREMVYAASSSPLVRVYASRDDSDNLTIFAINNSPGTDFTVQINIAGLIAEANGQSWLMQGAGQAPGGASTPLQDLQDIQINGQLHPNPLTVSSMEGNAFTAGNSFEITLPKSSIMFLQVPIYTQVPYDGNAWAIPGTIEAENYDMGGEGTAYHDSSAGNDGNNYRCDDVDIESCDEGGYDVNGIYAGEWLEYTVDVESTALYQIEARVASADSNGLFHFELDGEDLTSEVNFSPTGDNQNYINVDVNGVLLHAGQHTLRLAMDSNGWNINWFKFTIIGGGTGKILREWWLGTSGDDVNKLTSNSNYPNKPTDKELITNIEGPANWADNYGTRIRGHLNPAADGNYTFWIAADDSAELWLSCDLDPNNAALIAYTSSPTASYEWDLYPQQQSSPVFLTAGQKYYIEALHKEGAVYDNIAVAWEGPGFSRQVIDGMYLSPYTPIKKCTVKAGKTIGLDNVSCLGDFAATAEQLAAAGRVNIKIYSLADDYLVYEQTIDFDAFTLKKNVYGYKYKAVTGQPGAITSLKFDTGKKAFVLEAKNVNLTGLRCPLYVTFDTGGYAGTAVAGETIVNGKKTIPIRLLSGYADTMALTKIRSYDNSEPNMDWLNVKGTVTVEDDSTVTDGLTITWGEQTFTIPGNQFWLVKTGRYKCLYTTADAVISADFDFTKCIFTINIKNATITSHSGTVTFGLSFGDYNETAEAAL